MTAFDELERQLRAAVRREHGARARKRWLRPPMLALAGALVIAGGALAATGAIRIGPVHDDHDPLSPPDPERGAGVRAGAAKPLALRVEDPAGGPPWTLRVFASSRGGSCVQIGQVVRGTFGVFVPPGTLEPLRAWPGGVSSLCSGQSRGGFPVVRGLQRIRQVGGSGDPKRCPGRRYEDCPILSVTLLRYGLLGPSARRVRLTDAGGRTLASMRTDARVGGAYLFAVAQPAAPYVAANAAERDVFDAYRRARKTATARGLTGVAATRAAMDATGRVRPSAFVRPPKVAVYATFADGRTIQVAGPGRSRAPLPGVGTRRPAAVRVLPPDVPVRVRVVKPARWASIELSFRAPRAITRFDVHYTSTLHGLTGLRCDERNGGYQATSGDVAAGETVRLVMRRRGPRGSGGSAWCPGNFSGEVRYSPPGRDVVVGRYAFSIP